MIRKPAIFSRVSFLWILVLFNFAFAFYLPGLAPVNFCPKDQEKANCKVKNFRFIPLFFKTGTF